MLKQLALLAPRMRPQLDTQCRCQHRRPLRMSSSGRWSISARWSSRCPARSQSSAPLATISKGPWTHGKTAKIQATAQKQKSEAKVAIHHMHFSLVLQMVMKTLCMPLRPLHHIRASAPMRCTQRLLELFAHAEPNTSLARRAPATSQSSLQSITNRCMRLTPLHYISQKLE